VGSWRQGQRAGQSRPADGGSDPGVDGSAGGRGKTGSLGFNPAAGHRTAGCAGIACSTRERGVGRGASGAEASRTWARLADFGSHRTGRSAVGAKCPDGDRLRAPAIGPRLVPVGLGTPAVAGRVARHRGAARCAACGGPVVGAPGSSGWLCRYAPVGGSALGPHSPSRGSHANRRRDDSGTSSATRSQRRSVALPGIFNDQLGILRLSAAQAGRLHVVGRDPPHDTARRPRVAPDRGPASRGWRAGQ
jgi:hypothetical protein